MLGPIPDFFIGQILSHIDIVELIGEFLPLKKRGHTHIACCPFHEEKTPSFNVVPKTQVYYCSDCGAHGNVIDFVVHYLQKPFVDAIEYLAQRVGLEIPHAKKPE
jgi:DNA primase